jgi:hypothetical protein
MFRFGSFNTKLILRSNPEQPETWRFDVEKFEDGRPHIIVIEVPRCENTTRGKPLHKIAYCWYRKKDFYSNVHLFKMTRLLDIDNQKVISTDCFIHLIFRIDVQNNTYALIVDFKVSYPIESPMTIIEVYKTSHWNEIKWLWVGYVKEKNSPLSLLTKDLIKLICHFSI